MPPSIPLPTRERHYLHPLLNDRQWDAIVPRDDDIVIASAFKAGTTWMQTIVANLIFQGREWPDAVMHMSPWVDRYRNDEEMQAMTSMLEAQTHRRFLKTHLPIDALRFLPKAKYVFLARDPRDIFMSLWNHHNNYSQERQNLHRAIGEGLGRPWPETPADLNDFFTLWITTSWFEWENEGFPYWSVFYNFQSWWAYRELENILLVHYTDLLNDTDSEIRRLAEFLEIEVRSDFWHKLLDNISLASMRRDGARIMGEAEKSFKGGASTFINKGTNGRWKGVLSDANLRLYSEAMNNNLDSEAQQWLEHGRSAG